VTTGIVVIGLGNTYRRDDGVGIAVATALDQLALPGVQVVTGIAEPMSLLEAWAGAALAVVIDATVAGGSSPGRIRRCEPDDLVVAHGRTSSHSLDLARAYALGQVLERVPNALVLFTVETGDVGYGVGLIPAVAAAVPKVVAMAAAEINHARPPT
jgi:hydrogenase maturation protease